MTSRVRFTHVIAFFILLLLPLFVRPASACSLNEASSCTQVLTIAAVGSDGLVGIAPVQECSATAATSADWITDLFVDQGSVFGRIAPNDGRFARWAVIRLECDQILVIECGVVDGSVSTCIFPTLTIEAPRNGARPLSQFVVLTGTGAAGTTLDMERNGVRVGSIDVDRDGRWEALVYMGPFALPTLTLQVQDTKTFEESNIVTVDSSYGTSGVLPFGPLSSNLRLLPLRRADIFVTGSRTSPQHPLYGPNFTHVALYLGGDVDGTPMVAEAVPHGGPGGLGEVRSAPLEQSTVWTDSDLNHIAAFRSREDVALSEVDRDAIVRAAFEYTSRGLDYWSIGDLRQLISTLLVPIPHRSPLSELNALKHSTRQFICSTLVWRAYWDGTGGTLDLSTPNNMSAAPGSLLQRFPSFLIDLLRPVFIVPETFVRSPRLQQVF